ncbi:MAG: PTS sugar transporter subunit IIA [Gemmatimonadaceae bacterium]|jgi:PTS system N-acetylgalactosamine-specific IIA component
MNEDTGGGPAKARAIVVGHGEFAAGLVSAVGQICGMADKLVVLSMMGMTPEDIEKTIRDQLVRTGAQVIFTDLPAGSATIAARRLVKETPGLVLVSGVNLATLLDFVFSTDLSPTEAARTAAERGKASLIVVGR